MLGGRYRVIEPLGAGGQGEVVAAADTWCADLAVVLKRVPQETVGALRSEFAALRTLHHPALVEARDLTVLDGVAYLVEARVGGESAIAWSQWRSPRDVVGAMAPVAHALAHLHVRGLVHLDASPANILIESGRATLIDLGLARAIGTAGAAGTPGFVAPEVLAAEPVTGAADVYSLAATVAAVLDPDPPLGWGQPDLSRIEDREVRALLDECLHPAPASRPSALALARRFAQLAGGEPAMLSRPLVQLPLCGRRPELALFEQWLGAGRGMLEVAGAAGVGKSAFLEACADRARSAGCTVVVASADDERALDSLVAQAVTAAPPDSPMLEELGADLATVVSHARLPAGTGRVATTDERAQLTVLALDSLARTAPVLVVVDDAGRATESVQRALNIWRERHVERGARILVATNDSAPFHLDPLDRDGVGAMLRVAFAEERPAAEADHLLNIVGGVPAAVVSILARLAQDGGSPLDVDASATTIVPRLPVELEALALAGGPVPEPVVRGLLGSVDDRASVLRAAVRDGSLGLLQTATGPAYRVPESVRRRTTPGRAAVAALAAGFESAGEPLSAAPVWARANETSRAIALLADVTGARADDALRALKAVAAAAGADAWPDDMVETWARLASAAGDLGELEDAAAVLRARGRDATARELTGACLIRLGRYREALAAATGNDPASAAVRARALLFVGQASEARAQAAAVWADAAGEARADLLDILGHSHFALGEVEEAKTVLSRALEEAETSGHPRTLSRARHALAIVLHRSGELVAARDLYAAALEHADVLSRVSRTLNYAALLQDLGELAEARERYVDALSQAVALANEREQARVGVNLANLHTLLGDLPAAVGLAEDTLELCEQSGLEHAAAMVSLVLAEAQLEREDVDASAAVLDRAAHLLDTIDDEVAASELCLLRARVAAARGDHDEARSLLEDVDAEVGGHLKAQLAFWDVRLAVARGAAPDENLKSRARGAVTLAEEGHDDELTWRSLAVLYRVLDRGGDRTAADVRERAAAALDALLARLPAGIQTTYLASSSRRELAGWVRQRTMMAAPVSTSQLGSVAYRRILAINRRLAREHEVEPLLELIVDAATELLGAERGFLLLRDGDSVRVAVARNFDRQSLEDGRQRISRSIANESLRMGEAILTTNAQEDQRFAGIQSVAALKVRSVICVPLRGTARDEDPVIGALYLDHRFQDRAFTDDDVELCESFADQAAIALENADLLEQTREQERRLAAQNERLERLNAQLQKEAAQYAEEAEAALRRLREEGPTVGVGRGFERIVGASDKLREALRLVDRFADTDVPVVIYGESGTGKELVARAIHDRSSRRQRPFVSINCGAIPENLIESELFGYKKGAFTGAVRDKAGLVQAAEGGTLLLDEIGEMPLTMQVKLLRVLQEKEFRPVGATTNVRADVRVVSASHENLEALVKNGGFREDLYYRLRVVEIPVPPLRERREDIPLLVDHFCRAITGQPAEERFTEDALPRLLGHDWPGNVRELENEVRRALALADGPVGIEDLSERFQAMRASGAAILADTARGSLREIVDGFERQVLLATLKRTGWNVRRAAKELGVSRAALYTRLTKFGITREEHA